MEQVGFNFTSQGDNWLARDGNGDHTKHHGQNKDQAQYMKYSFPATVFLQIHHFFLYTTVAKDQQIIAQSLHDAAICAAGKSQIILGM